MSFTQDHWIYVRFCCQVEEDVMIRGARLEKQCPNFPLYFLYYLPEAAKFVEEAAGERTNQSCYRSLPKS